MDLVLKGLNGLPVYVRVAYDPKSKVIHVLDLYHEGSPSVTNSIEVLQPQIIRILKEKCPDYEYERFAWYLYAPGDLVSEFRDGAFIPVLEGQPILPSFAFELNVDKSFKEVFSKDD